MLVEAKREAKKAYNENVEWNKLPARQKLRTVPTSFGYHLSDCILYYKTNGFKNFKGYMLLIMKTRKEYAV